MLYFGHPATGAPNESVSDTLKDRNLSLLRAKPSDVHLAVIALENQPGYSCYIRNLPAYMHATAIQRTVRIQTGGHQVKEPSDLLPWSLPPVSYSFGKAPTDAVITKLQEHSSIVQGGGKNPLFVMNEPTIDLVKDLVTVKRADPKARCLYGTINANAIKVVLLLQRIFSLFLCTHVYAAYRHIDDYNTEVNELSKDGPSNKKRKAQDVEEDEKADEEEVEDDDEGNQSDASSSSSESSKPATIDRVRLVYAKPTNDPNDKWGSYEHIPNASGIFVPYVHELAVQDNETLPALIERYFVKCLASDVHGMVQKLTTIRSAWGMICSTRLGHEVSHLAKCIDLALSAQAFVFPVYSNSIYEGTVICGAGFHIVDYKRVVYEPLSYERLQDMVRDSSAHSRALREIVEMVDNAGLGIEECTSIRNLAKKLKDAGLDDVSRSKIVKCAFQLSFNNRYWSTSTHYIVRMMAFLQNPESEIPDDVPMLPKYIFYDNRTDEVMSAFGYNAPSFLIPNGTKIELTRKDPPENFHVRTLPIAKAIGDLNYIMEMGSITNNNKNLSRQHRDLALKKDDREKVWKAMKEIYMTNNTTVAEETVAEGVPAETKDDLEELW